MNFDVLKTTQTESKQNDITCEGSLLNVREYTLVSVLGVFREKGNRGTLCYCTIFVELPLPRFIQLYTPFVSMNSWTTS